MSSTRGPAPPSADPPPDQETAVWLRDLRATSPARDAAIDRLHGLLLRVSAGELRRRVPQTGIDGAELDDLAHQAAADAMIALLAKLDTFRGESRFTTWAYKFAVLEVSTKVGRHFWRRPSVALDTEDWDRLPGRFGFDPADRAEWGELIDALRDAVDTRLTEHQRRIFVAIVLNGVPLDALVARTGSNRNAIYKTLFDARRKLRAALVAQGHLDHDPEPRP